MLTMGAFFMALTIGGTAQVHAATLPVLDLSEWQGNITATEAKQLKTETGGVILRVQYGSSYADKTFVHNVKLLKSAGVKYGVYSFSQYTSASDAKAEAKELYTRAKGYAPAFYVNDAEVNTITSGSYSTATKAWATEMQSLTSQPVYLYSYRSFYTSYINSLSGYDGFWLAAYTSVTPTPKNYQLWQYSESHYSTALKQSVDASKQVSGSWFGTSTISTSSYPYGGRTVGETVQVRSQATFYGSTSKIDPSLMDTNLTIKQVKTIKSGQSRQAVLLYNGSTVVGWFRAQDVQAYYHASYVKKLKVTNKAGVWTYFNGNRVTHYKKGTTLSVSGFKLVNGLYEAVHSGHTTYFTANKACVKWVK